MVAILIRKKDGILVNITDVSNIISKSNTAYGDNKQMAAFLNKNLLDFKYKNMTLEIQKLLRSFQNRNHLEIEKKYVVEENEVIEDILTFIKNFDSDYKIIQVQESPKLQRDFYYDTDDKMLYNTKKTLRIRLIDEDKLITIKKPVLNEDSANNQRFEFEENIKSEDISENKDFILKHLPELKKSIDDKCLENSIVIQNERKKYLIEKNQVRFELASDKVKYFKSNDEFNPIRQENEIEIELKSDYSHRICLDELTSQMEKNLNMKPSSESKYIRGMNYIKL